MVATWTVDGHDQVLCWEFNSQPRVGPIGIRIVEHRERGLKASFPLHFPNGAAICPTGGNLHVTLNIYKFLF